MGIYRFVLAALVVLFHFGGLSWIVGRIAVFAFYSVSGFLIFQVLDRVYLRESRGVWRFFSNRLVRLLPLYLLYMAMTLAFSVWVGPAAFVDPASRTIRNDLEQEGPAEMLLEDVAFEPDVEIDGSMLVLQFEPDLIPQGWSIGVEASFYLIAPIVVLTTRRHAWRVLLWILGGLAAFLWALHSAGADLDRFQVLVYKNAIASAMVFFTGGAFYYLRRRWGQPLRFEVVGLLLVAWLVVVTVPAWDLNPQRAWSAGDFAEYLWLTLLLGALLALTKVRRLEAVDHGGGNLCYGIYLNHFLVAALLLHAGATSYVGGPGTLTFGVVVLLASIALAYLTHHLVERAFEPLRTRVRGAVVREPSTSPVAPLRRPAAVLAVAACLALMANPIGEAVEAVTGEVVVGSVSPPFDIRWTASVDEGMRRRFEQQLGLVDAAAVARDPRGRTWTYRLPTPTRARIRAIVEHPAVEDTARIDTEGLEILQ